MSTSGLSRAQAAKYVERFASARVCVLGDVMLDRYFWGEVDRISPEAPVPVVRVNRRSARLGGAANVAANLSSLGAQVTLVGFVGDDRTGGDVERCMAERGIATDRLIKEPGRETTEKVRIIARNQQVVRADFEMNPPLHDEQKMASLQSLCDEHGEFDALVISDYGKGVVSESTIGTLIRNWRRHGKPVLVDPHVGHFRWYAGASLITPNTREAQSFFGVAPPKDELFGRLAFQMRQELELDALLITRGEDGMTLFLANGDTVHVPTVAKEVYDVTGAGDTVISLLGASLAAGVPLVDSVILANQAAGEVVKEVGTSAISIDLLLASFS